VDSRARHKSYKLRQCNTNQSMHLCVSPSDVAEYFRFERLSWRTDRRLSPSPPRRAGYGLDATKLAVVPCSLSSTSIFIVLPSGEIVMRLTEMTFPSRLSVSSMVFALIFFSDTLVTPGSPLNGYSLPSNFAS